MMKDYSISKILTYLTKEWTYYVLLGLMTLILFTPLSYSNSNFNDFTDFDEHMQWAMDMKNGKPIPSYVIAHSGWQLLVIFVNDITGVSFRNASFVATLLCWLGIITVLYWWFLPVFTRKNMPLYLGSSLILGMSIATPISLLWFFDGLMYLGYIGITSYQNPTIMLLKPFALLQFIFAVRLFKGMHFTNREIVLSGLVSFLGTFAKPSFAICLIPSLIIIVVYQLFIKKQFIDVNAFVFGIVLPIGLVVTWQYFLTYAQKDSETVIFMPFRLMSLYSKYLLLKLLLSVIFPLLMVIFYPEQVILDKKMILSWAIFIVSLFFTYFFAEGGKRFFDGNFTWGSEISLFILFVVSTIFYLEQLLNSHARNWVLRFAWAGQVISGIVYYFYCIYNHMYF